MKRRPFLNALLCTCWIPFLFAAIAVSVQALRITGKPTEYVAAGKIISGFIDINRSAKSLSGETENNLPELICGTAMEILKSNTLRNRALERVRSLHPELKEIELDIRVTRTRGSTVLKVESAGAEPKYTRVFLDSLLDEYSAFRMEMINNSVPALTNKIIEEVLTRERQTKECFAALESFQQLNDPMLLSSEHERLVKEVSTLRGEVETLKLSSKDSQIQLVANSLKEAEKKLEEIWAKEAKHLELKKRYEDSERDYNEWKKTLERVDMGQQTACSVGYILERPNAAVPDEPDLWLSLYLAGLTGAAAGVLVMFIAAFALTRLSKYPEVSPPPLN
jgi:hypothetical protein